jgi:SAM-dependent methyltransferase
MLFDYLEDKEALETIERDDGYVEAHQGCELYFADYDAWPDHEREALDRLTPGRILDLGCGAGRAELHLQALGYEITGIDNSPLAVQVCQKRGVKDARLLPVTLVSPDLGAFASILMLGNNWGLMANFSRARWLLRRFYRMTTPRAQIIAGSNDIYQTTADYHFAYQAFNRERGRMSGQIRMRVLYKLFRSHWFDYLMVSPQEMRTIVEGTGWKVKQFIQQPQKSAYAAVLAKD